MRYKITFCLSLCIFRQSTVYILILRNNNHISLQDPEAACPGLTGNITQYCISFQTGSVVDTESVNSDRCTVGRCNHTFEPPSNPPSSYDSVSVAAENVVGVGAARNCTTQSISELPAICSFRSLVHQ